MQFDMRDVATGVLKSSTTLGNMLVCFYESESKTISV